MIPFNVVSWSVGGGNDGGFGEGRVLIVKFSNRSGILQPAVVSILAAFECDPRRPM